MYETYDSTPRTASGSSISAELRRLAPHYGFSVIDSVGFTRGLIGAVVDNVVVDRYGVLLIDAEPHEGATIRGTDTDGHWTATLPSGHVAEFRNPLFLNTGNENLVKQALSDIGIRLETAEIRSAVVFAGADISGLSLVEVSAAKVKTREALAEIFEMRNSFPPSSGRLTGPDIDHIVSELSAMAQETPFTEEPQGPWHADPAVTASIGVAMAVPPAPAYGEFVHRLPGELAGHHTGATEGPSLRAALLTLATILVIVLTIVAGVVYLPQLQAGSTAAWTVLLVLSVALAELIAANVAASRSGKRRRPGGALGGAARFVARLVVVFLIVAAGWALIAGGTAQRWGETLTAQFDSPLQLGSRAANQPTNPGVTVAKRRLRETAPRVYKSTSNLNTPSIHPETDGRTSYTWSYTPKGASAPASFTLTVDIEGRVVSP